MTYKLGSLFDGSGGFPLAGSLCGIEPCWASEVEPYPIAVTRERFPNMKHLGDISKINGAEIEPVDIITFGSPCQDLSVAGKRAGLKHEANGDEETTRSGLFMEAVRIIKEMRTATNGKYPRFALWENVPGAFSSNKGEDFRVVCEELIKIVEPSAVMPAVPPKGWSYSDSYIGDGWSLAYRVFDAQYWGVPQRRRRIHLVADFRGECAREVLFERDGVRGYFTQSGTQGQGTPTDAEGSTGADDREGEDFDGYNGDLTGDKAATLGVNYGVSTGRNGVIERRRQLDDVVYSFDSLSSNSMKSSNPHSGCRAVQIAKTLDTTNPNPCKNQRACGSLCARDYKGVGNQYVMEDKLIIEEAADSEEELNNSPASPCGINGDKSVCYSCDEKMGQTYVWEEQANTLAARDYKQPQAVCYCAPPRYIVRRLTPTECARLQGFADWWGHIEPKETLTDEEFRFWLEVRNTHAAINGKKVQDYTEKQMLTWYNKLWTDSAEYKMWGNGIALPPALYCMQGILFELFISAGDHSKNEEFVAITEDEVTDLSDAPEEVKAEIIKNDELLHENEHKKYIKDEEIMENIENNVATFNAVAQLKRLADERKALANLKPDDTRFTDDVRAIEYAVGVLEAVGI